MPGIKGKSGRKDHSTGKKAGRKAGTAEKTKKLFGYRYTEEEYNDMTEIIEKLKSNGKTTSKSILEIFKFYKENKK